jgi:hypothetical protein
VWALSSWWKKPVILAAAFTAPVLGLAADVTALGVLPTPVARFLLIAVALAGVLYFCIRAWQLYYREKVRELREQLADQAEKLSHARSAHQLCLQAIERMMDREKLLRFSETLELTVRIGEDDDGDLIVEERVTSPDQPATGTTLRPIVPTHGDQVASAEALGFQVRRDGGQITFIPLREQINLLKVLLVFEPAMTTRTAWQVEYHPKGLWRPLRERGFDHLGWDDRLQSNDKPSAFTRFTAVFEFPSGAQPSVKEWHGHGSTTEPEHLPDGTWRVVWCDEHPAGRHYDWDITQPPRGTPEP